MELAVRGIDIHGGKGAVNFDAVRKSGRTFAFVKCSEGVSYNDPLYAMNVKAARKAGLRVGSYHFARPDHNSPEAEAAHFLSRLDLQPGDLLPVLDYETPPTSAAWAIAFMEAVEKHIGASPIFYSYLDFIRRMNGGPSLGRFPLWLAAYSTTMPTVPHPYLRVSVWQHSSSATVPGVGGRCDSNVLVGATLDELTYKASKPKPKPAPKPADPEAHPEPKADTPFTSDPYAGMPPMWAWFKWRDEGADKATRPRQAPRMIPASWWVRYRIHRGGNR